MPLALLVRLGELVEMTDEKKLFQQSANGLERMVDDRIYRHVNPNGFKFYDDNRFYRPVNSQRDRCPNGFKLHVHHRSRRLLEIVPKLNFETLYNFQYFPQSCASDTSLPASKIFMSLSCKDSI